jgi:hypothetical protein
VTGKSEVVEEAHTYLEKTIKSNNFDLVVAKERRGYAIYKDARLSQPKGALENLPFFPDGAIDGSGINVKGKNVLAFDEVVRTGKTMDELRTRLLKEGAASVKIASLAKWKTSKLETLPPAQVLEKAEMESFRDRLSRYMEDEQLTPIQSEQIYVLGHFSGAITGEKIRKTLTETGATYSDSPEHVDAGVNKVGVTSLKLLPKEALVPPKGVSDFPSWKIRVRYKDNSVCLLPIAYPEIEHEEHPPPHNVRRCLCQRYKGSNWYKVHGNDAEWLLYCQCIIFNYKVLALEAFLKSWNAALRKHEVEFVLDQVQWEDGQFRFEDKEALAYLKEISAAALAAK